MMTPMTSHVAAPHMTKFRCIGTDCEDTCCKAWEIPITDDDVSRLTNALGSEGASDMVRRLPNGRGGTITVLRRLADGACTQLDENQWCGLQIRLGEGVLPVVCTSYPRLVIRVGDQLELTGRVSCPEVARLCLLGDEPTQIPSPVEPFSRFKVRLEVSPDGDVPYLTPFVAVRDKLIELVMAPGFSVASRLYFIAVLAEKLGPYFHRDATIAEPERLAEDLAAISEPEIQAALHAQRGASSPMDGLGLQVAQGLIYSRLDVAPAFARVATKAAQSHGVAAGIADRAAMLKQLAELGPERIWRSHMARRQRLGAEQTQRLDLYLARYCRSYFLQDAYSQSPNLLEYLMLLVLRVTLVRFLLVAHPDIGPDSDAAATDAAAVEVFYTVTRAYDHSTSIRQGLSTMLAARGMLTVDHAAALLKL